MSRFSDLERGRAVSRALGFDLRELPPGSAAAGARAGPGADDELPVLAGTVERLDHLRAPHGGVHAGALLALADSTAGPANGLAVLPRWVVTTNLTMRTVGAVPAGPLRVAARVLRRGRSSAVAAFEIRDGGRSGPSASLGADPGPHGEGAAGGPGGDRPGVGGWATPAPVAVGRLTSAALDPEGGPPPLPRPLHLATPPVTSPVPWTDVIGARRDRDAFRLPVTDDVRNPWGIVHGGATAALVDVAAAGAAVADGATPRAFTADVALHYLAPGRVGPLRADTRVLGRRPDGHLVEVRVHDEGAGDRMVASAVVTVRGG